MRLIRPSTAWRLATLSWFLFAAACDSTSEPKTPSQITATSGAAITGRAGEAKTVTVSVLASNGKTLASQPVSFSVASGGGSVAPTTATTDANGQATTTWTLGNTLGAQTLTVAAGGITQTIAATVSAGLPATVTIQQGSGQTAPAGTAVGSAPAVIVRDAGGNPVSGVTVAFTTSPGGSVTPAQTTTDAGGVARVTNWTLGNQVGTYTLTAFVLDQNIKTGNPVTITAVATAGAASRVTAVAGLPTTGTVGSALAGTALPGVTVVDANGNPVQNVAVTFAVTSGGGTLTGATATTNAQGVATVGGFTLGQTAGPNVITATAQGAGTVTIAITGTAGNAATTQIVSGNNQSVRAGQPLLVGPSVKVVDVFGNAVSGATVNFVATVGGGSVLGGTQITNAAGIATVGGYTLGVTPGPNTLVARVAGAADVSFSATGLAGAPATITKISGDTMTVIAFRTASQPFVVEVRDSANFPVTNATVTFALVNTNGGALSTTSATTDANGRARSTFTANGFIGVNTVNVTVGNLPAVQFQVTTSGNTAGSVVILRGNGQVGTVGTQLPISPAVIVRDASGNPVPGVTVFFEPSGQGGVPASTVTTDANGVASPGQWTLGPTPGTNVLDVTVSAINVAGNPIRFTATGFAVPAGATVTVIPNLTPATAPVGSTLAAGVQVKDANGNPLANLTVQFQVGAGGGTIPGTTTTNPAFTTTTDSGGFARVPSWVLGPNVGLNTLTVNVLGGGPTTIISVTAQ